MPDQYDHVSKKVLITGRSGTGKTTYFLRVLSHAPYHRRFIYDGEGEIGHKLGIRAARTLDELKAQLAGAWVIFDPATLYPGRHAEGFEFFCEWAFTAAAALPGKKLLAVDELQKVTDNHQNPWAWSLVLETGRRKGLDVLAIAHQPNLIHNRVRAQVTEIVSFAQAEKNAIAWLVDAGFLEEDIRALCPGQFIARDLGSGAEESGRIFWPGPKPGAPVIMMPTSRTAGNKRHPGKDPGP